MRRRFTSGAAAMATVVFGGVGLARVLPHRGVAVCGPADARTVASSRVARVYDAHGVVYGCSAATAKRTRLGYDRFPFPTPHPWILSPTPWIRFVRVSGELAAYAADTRGIDTGYTNVIVMRLSDGARLASEPATTRQFRHHGLAHAGASVESLVLRRDGDVAWIAGWPGAVPWDTEVHELDHTFRLLDTGRAIKPRSLRLIGSKLTWRHGERTRAARLR